MRYIVVVQYHSGPTRYEKHTVTDDGNGLNITEMLWPEDATAFDHQEVAQIAASYTQMYHKSPVTVTIQEIP